MLRKITVPLAALLVGFGLTFGVVYLWRNSAAKKPEANLIGERLPAAALSTPNGEKFDNAELAKGKVLIIFLSAACDACKTEIGQIKEIYPEISSQIRFYGINVDPKEKQNALAENKDINFPVVLDENREFAGSLAVKGVPTKFLIEDGVIKKIFLGRFIDKTDARQKLELP
jgi:peroxiredoxin